MIHKTFLQEGESGICIFLAAHYNLVDCFTHTLAGLKKCTVLLINSRQPIQEWLLSHDCVAHDYYNSYGISVVLSVQCMLMLCILLLLSYTHKVLKQCKYGVLLYPSQQRAIYSAGITRQTAEINIGKGLRHINVQTIQSHTRMHARTHTHTHTHARTHNTHTNTHNLTYMHKHTHTTQTLTQQN